MEKDLRRIVYCMHPLERKVIGNLIFAKELEALAKRTGLSEAEVRTGVEMLREKELIFLNEISLKLVVLDKLGRKYVDMDLPEVKFLNEIVNGDKKMYELSLDKDEFSTAIGILKKKNLVSISKDGGEMVFSVKTGAKDFLKSCKNELSFFLKGVNIESMSEDEKRVYDEFKKRKGFLKEVSKKKYTACLSDLGESVAKEINEKYTKLDLTENLTLLMLKDGSWKDKEFRYYDVGVDVPIMDIGRRHPMIEANNVIRDVFVEMGFKEMEGPMVESEFWCFDALWIPQDHPARDDQDTFFLEGKAKVPSSYVKKVKEMHEEGLKLSHTSKGGFSKDVTARRILRTHSTATTFRTLYELGKAFKKGENIDGKYFYNANNFRNEAVDATHLAEFFQAEGCIIGDELSLADLMGFVKEYYAKLGIHKIRFKPTFNPYTEPSMEAHYYDEKLGKWYALINSGIFRPETLAPLGLEGKKIIGFGMGASRVATLLSGKTSMREITGGTCDFHWLKTRPVMTRKIVEK